MKTPLSLIVLATFIGCLGGAFAAGRSSPKPMEDMYKRGDGRDTIQCRAIRPRNICGALTTPSLIYFDCSDANYDCLFDSTDVLATPKSPLVLGQRYQVFGSELTVERCFGPNDSCDVAMISSRCSSGSDCNCRSTIPGRATVFYFSTEKGITAFRAVADIPASSGLDPKAVSDAAPLTTYVLVEESGFLRTTLSLDRAKPRTGCHT
jgi:hypothetical protein